MGATVEASATTWDTLLSATLASKMKQVRDQISVGLLLFKWMDASSNKKTGFNGHRLEFPVRYELNDTIGRRGAYDQVPLTAQEGFTTAYIGWKDLCGSVVISDEELDKCAGKEQVFDLLDTKTEQLKDGLQDTLNSDLFSTGGSDNQVNGLQYWLTTSTGTVAGINDATNTWWANQSATTVGSFASNGRDKMRQLYNDCSAGMNLESPTHILTTADVYEYFEKTLDSAERLTVATNGPSSANVGVKKITFKDMEIGWDADCPSGYMYLLNMKNRAIQWNILAGNDFKSTDFVRPADQRARASIWSVKGNLVFTARRRNCVMTGISA
jgi:hypothetical protein